MSLQTQKENLAYTKMQSNKENKPTIFKKKDLAFQAGSLLNNPVYISKDLVADEGVKQWGFFEDHDDLANYLENDNHIYEVIKHDQKRQSYFDFDGKRLDVYKELHRVYADEGDEEALKQNSPEEDIHKFFEDCVSDMISDFRLENEKDFPGISREPDLVWIDASRGSKFSKHVVDRSIHFNDKKASEVYHMKLQIYMNDDSNFSPVALCFDKCVYDTDRSMRCVNQSKKTVNKPRPLQLSSSHTIKDTLITYISPESNLFNVPEKWQKKHRETPIVIRTKEELENDIPELTLLESHLSDERFVDYNEWMKTVWCMYATGYTSEQIHYISNERCPEKYDWQACESLIQQYNHGKSKYSIDTLRAWAKSDSGFEPDRVLEKTQNILPKEREQHMQFLDLLKKYTNSVIQSGPPLDQFHKDVSKCVQYIMGGECQFSMYTNDDKQFDICKKIPLLQFKIRYANETDEDMATKKSLELHKYIATNPLSFPLYNKISFKPNNVGVEKNELNIWPGFKAQEVQTVDMDIVNVFLHHIKQVWASNDDEIFKYQMSWLAQIIKTPEKKTEVCMVLQGGQGLGKTLPCDILLKHVFGDNIGVTASGLGSLTQRFNGSTMGKIFCNVNELSVVGDEGFSATFDKMKSLITDRKLQVEKKGLEHIVIDNFLNVIATTNHHHTIKIEADDRRYACFQVADIYRQNTEYFSNFIDVLDNNNAGDHLFTYFLRYADDDMVNLRKIPMTCMKQDLLNNCKSAVQRFVDVMQDDFTESELFDWVGKDDVKAVSYLNFYELYKQWCQTNGEKTWSNRAVGNELKSKKLYKTVGENRNGGVKKRHYTF